MIDISLEQKYKIIVKYFQTILPNPKIELDYESPFQLLIAVILSAQCTDARVNIVTKKLFRAFPTAEDMASASLEIITKYINTISYPNSKAKYLIETSKILVNKYNSEIPSDENILQELPGVGRKTAHVVVFNLYNKAVLAVDTHVFRVAKRLGLASENCKTPIAVENAISKVAPREFLGQMNHWLVLHGRYTCKASKPKCETCGLKIICQEYGKNKNKL